MELVEHTIEYPHTFNTFRIYFIADNHIGNKGYDKEKNIRDIERIKNDPLAYWIAGGDAIDAIIPSDKKRFDPKTIAEVYNYTRLSNLPDEQMDDYIKLHDPIKDKCLGIHCGNHEETIRKHHSRDVLQKVCNAWKIPCLQDTAFTRIRFVRMGEHLKTKPSVTTVTIFSAHSRVAGRKKGNKANRLHELMASFEADIYMLAHGHDKVTIDPTMLSVPVSGKMKLFAKKKVGIMTGGYLRTYQVGSSSYGEPHLYPPSDLGALSVIIKPYTREYAPSHNIGRELCPKW